MDNMPEYKDGFITLRRGGKWVQIPLSDLPKIIEEDNRGADESSDLPSGS